ncbi:MAG: MtrB/PioB family decaheme-associated outer membrane protein [Arenicellales bacterium]
MATRFKYLQTGPALRLIRKTVWFNSCLVILLGLTNTALAEQAPAVENNKKTDQTITADPAPVTEQSTGQNTEQFGYVEAGMGYQSEDSFWFGRYTGLTDKGPFLIGNFDYSSKKEDGSHTEAYGRRLGLDSRSILFTHGVQGKYELDLIFDQLPNFITDTAITPYVDTGDNTLTLPGSVLDEENYRQLDIETHRTRTRGKISFTPADNWKMGLAFRREDNEGTRQIGGSLGYSARNQAVSILPKPVDYTTNLMDASVEYKKGKGYIELAYHLSMFRNANDSLSWQNPFPVEEGTAGEFGRLALEPDNDFQQLMLTGGYRLPWNTTLTGVVSSGVMTQDQQYLPYTINDIISADALPRDSLDGKIKQNIINLQLASRPNSKWNFNGSYRYHDHDNSTAQAPYTFIIADSQNTGTKAKDETDLTVVNQPYSYTRQLVKLDGKYRFNRAASVMLGYDYENMQRENSEVDETDEQEVWGKFKWKVGQHHVPEIIGGSLDGWLKLGHTSRDGSGYHPPAADEEGFYIENPLLRKYNLADLERDQVMLYLSYAPLDKLSFSANASYAMDDYDESIIGLTEATNSSGTIEATFLPTENVTSYIYYTRDLTNADQAGRQAEATQTGSLTDRYGPDWYAQSNDTMDNVGVGIQWQNILPKIDIGADYVYSKGTGETEIQATGATPFPDIKTELNSFKLYAQYNHSRSLAYRLRYWHENFDSQDWSLDNVDSVSLDYPNSLFMSEGSPNYDVDVIGLSVLYSF